MPRLKVSPVQTTEDLVYARRYRRAQARRSGRAGWSLVGIRVAELERHFDDRWGAALPEDDAGVDDLFVILNHCAFYTEARPRMTAAAVRWAPWMPADALDDMIFDIIARPLRWTADKLAQRLGIDDATRTRLGLRTIGATDVTAKQRAERRRERDRLEKQAKRRAAGVKPRPVRRETLARQAPWRALGISRSAWFRRRQRDRATAASTTYRYLYAADAAVSARTERTLQ